MALRKRQRVTPKAVLEKLKEAETITPSYEYYHPMYEGDRVGSSFWFDNIASFAAYADETSQGFNGGSYGIASSRRNPTSEWFGKCSYEQAQELSRSGWSEGAQKVDDLMDKVDDHIRAVIPMTRSRLVPAMVGARVNVPAFLAGHPKQYIHQIKADGSTRTVRIAMLLSASSSVEADTMIRRGVAVAAVVRALEARRVRCEVIGSFDNTGMDWAQPRLKIAVCIKKAADKLDPGAVAFALAHPAFYRRLGFAMWEGACQLNKGNMPGGYGSVPMDFAIPDALNLGSIPCYTDASMQEFVTQQVKSIIAS